MAVHFNIPVLVSTQMGRDTSRREREGLLSGIQWADSFSQDSDALIQLFQDEDLLLNRRMRVILMTQREGMTGGFYVNWNLDTMDFGTVPAAVGESAEEYSEFSGEEMNV